MPAALHRAALCCTVPRRTHTALRTRHVYLCLGGGGGGGGGGGEGAKYV